MFSRSAACLSVFLVVHLVHATGLAANPSVVAKEARVWRSQHERETIEKPLGRNRNIRRFVRRPGAEVAAISDTVRREMDDGF